MAKTFAGGTQVERGYYVNGSTFEFANVSRDGTALPGGPDARYVRVPTLVAMVAAPALGGLFVMALPFLGFGMVAYAIVKKLRSGAKEVAATVISPAMPVGSTALTGSRSEDETKGETAEDVKLDQLAKEIEAKRSAK